MDKMMEIRLWAEINRLKLHVDALVDLFNIATRTPQDPDNPGHVPRRIEKYLIKEPESLQRRRSKKGPKKSTGIR